MNLIQKKLIRIQKSSGDRMAIELTAFEKEQAQCAKKINEYKLTSEANIVASIFKNPELLYNVDLKLEDFSHNIWKCWFAVAYGLIIKEKKLGLDEITVGIYLEKHPKLKNKIQEYGDIQLYKMPLHILTLKTLIVM